MKAEIVLTKFDFTPHLLKIARERVELVLDEDSPFLELCALAGYDQDDMTLGIYIQLKHIIKILMFILLKKKVVLLFQALVLSGTNYFYIHYIDTNIYLCSGVMCIVSANVATMAGGAMNETSALKGGRLHQIAIQNKLPTVTFVQSVRKE